MKNRDISIDALRGIVVALMVASHTVWFLSNDQNVFWNIMRSWGDSVCFITFLFVFGISLYFSILSKDYSDSSTQKRGWGRLLKLVGGYYIIAFAGLLPFIKSPDLYMHALKTVLFIEVPGFTEFMVPFIVFTLICLLFKRYRSQLTLISGKNILLKLLLIGWGVYGIGMILYLLTRSIQLPEVIGSVAAILVGHDGFLRFTIFEYTLVVLLGIYFGYQLKQPDMSAKVQWTALKLFLGLYVIAFIIWASELWKDNLYINMFFRWPPSLLFMLFGLCFALFAFWLLKVTNVPPLHRMLGKLGTDSMGILVFHIVVLRLLEAIGVDRTGSFLSLAGYFIILLLGFVILKFVYVTGLSRSRKIKTNAV